MRALLLCLALLTGCATMIDEHQAPPPRWPSLEVRDNIVGIWEIQKRCYKHVNLGWKLLGGFAGGCAEINFADRTCNIYRAYDASEEWLAHEEAHCRGYSHVGETWAADALRAYEAYVAGQAVGRAAR